MTGLHETAPQDELDPYKQLRETLMGLSLSQLSKALSRVTHDLARAVLSNGMRKELPSDRDPMRNYESKPASAVAMPDGTIVTARCRDLAQFALGHENSVVGVEGFDRPGGVATQVEFDTGKRLDKDPSTQDMLAVVDNVILLQGFRDQLAPQAEE